MRNIALVVLAVLSPAVAAAAEFTRSARGTTTAQFLKLGAGARGLALGEAYSAAADDATALYWNPAAMTQVEKRSVTVMRAEYLDSIAYNYGAFAQNLGEAGAFGLGVQHLTAGAIAETDQAGVQTGTFRPTDLALSAGYALETGGFGLGLAAKLIRTKIASTGRSAAVDLGLLSPRLLDERLRVSAVVQNAGSRIKLDSESGELPLTMRLGAAFRGTERWLLTAEAVAPRDNGPHAAVGAEYRLAVGDKATLAGRLGFNSRTVADVDGVTGVSTGIGVAFQRSSLDYAFVPFGSVGHAHRLSLTFGF